MRAGQVAGCDSACVGGSRRAYQECEAEIFGVQLAQRARLRLCVGAGVDDGRFFSVEIDRKKNARRAVAHREDRGQNEGGDLGQLAPDSLAFKAGLGGSALEQRGRQLAIEERAGFIARAEKWW